MHGEDKQSEHERWMLQKQMLRWQKTLGGLGLLNLQQWVRCKNANRVL